MTTRLSTNALFQSQSVRLLLEILYKLMEHLRVTNLLTFHKSYL